MLVSVDWPVMVCVLMCVKDEAHAILCTVQALIRVVLGRTVCSSVPKLILKRAICTCSSITAV